ncbi:hypothetical protein [Persephonella sp.]
MKNVKVFEDIWLESRIKVEERSVLMQLLYEMDNTSKAVIPSYKYLEETALVSHAKKAVYSLQKQGILEVSKEEPGRFIEIKLTKGKSAKAPYKIWNLTDKWWRTLMLTLYLKKANKDYVWIDNAEIAHLFGCSPRTARSKLAELDKQGLILRERYGYKYKVILLYLEI